MKAVVFGIDTKKTFTFEHRNTQKHNIEKKNRLFKLKHRLEFFQHLMALLVSLRGLDFSPCSVFSPTSKTASDSSFKALAGENTQQGQAELVLLEKFNSCTFCRTPKSGNQ